MRLLFNSIQYFGALSRQMNVVMEQKMDSDQNSLSSKILLLRFGYNYDVWKVHLCFYRCFT